MKREDGSGTGLRTGRAGAGARIHDQCSHATGRVQAGLARRAWRALPVLVALGLPAVSLAVVPLLVVLGHRVIKDMVLNQVKGQLIGSLAGMGCKGAHLAGLIAQASAAHGGLGGPRLPGGLPGGLGGAMKHGPAGAAGGLAGTMGGGAPGGAAGALGSGAGGTAGTVAGAVGEVAEGAAQAGRLGVGGKLGRSAGLLGGLLGKVARKARPSAPGSSGRPIGVPADVSGSAQLPDLAKGMEVMRQQHPGMAGSLTPEQSARADEVMGQMNEAMSHPLSRAETLEVFDELASLGVLTDSMRSEARECILLAGPGAEQAVGTSGAMLKAVVLPNLRTVKARLANLAPGEEDQLADGVVEGLHEASADDRKHFQEGLGAGFFPPSVVEKVRARLKQ